MKILGRRACQVRGCGSKDIFPTLWHGRVLSVHEIPTQLRDVVAETEHAYLLDCGHELSKTLPMMWRSEEMYAVKQATESQA